MLKRSLPLCVAISVVLMVSGCDFGGEAAPEIVGGAQHAVIKPAPNFEPYKPSYTPRLTDKNFPPGWIPATNLENKRRWKGIVIHHSAADYGDAAHEHKVHKSRNFDGLGYHFVINNGVRRNGYGKRDGLVEVGYRWRKQETGAHCRENGGDANYYNKYTVGVCLIGDFEKTRPTRQQMRSLIKLVQFLKRRYNIRTSQIKGHGDIKATKCPGKYFSMAGFKRML